MKTFKNKKGSFYAVIVFLVSAICASTYFSSCEVGLGGAVDTQPPKIEINNPPIDAVIRDNFALSGTYSDDGKIDSVSVALKRIDITTNDFKEYKDFELTYDEVEKGAGTWKIPIAALSEDGQTRLLPDGSYQAIVTIKDKSARTTVQNTTFTVDNTPPVLILQRPATDVSVINEDDIDTFGKTFSLEGRAADDNNIDHIDIKIFSDPQKTDLIHTVTLENVPLSIALDVAKWGEENQNYEKIYGSTTQDGAKKRYCSIEAYDSAQRYPVDGTEQTDQDKNGNFTNEYYLYNDIAGSTIANYKVTELYSIMSGNYNADGRSATDTITSVKAVLDSLKKDSGCFKLNPLNNPTYKLSGWINNEDFVTFEDSSITLDIEPGLDGIALNKSTIKPYFYKLDSSGNITGSKIYLKDADYTITGAASYKVTIKITRKDINNQNMSYGKYLVGVEGFDFAPGTPNELMPDNPNIDPKGYEIDIQSVGAAPTLTSGYKVNGNSATGNIITVPKYQANGTSDSEITISYEIVSGQEISDFTVKVDEGDPLFTFADLEKDTEQSTDDKFVYNFTRTIKFTEIEGLDLSKSKEHTITVTASNGTPATDRKTFMYDIEGPQVEIRDVAPIAYKNFDINGDPVEGAQKYLNGSNISFTVSFTDDYTGVDKNTNKPVIEFVQNGNVVSTIASNITEFPYHVINADTTGLTGEVSICVTAYDVAGNKTVVPQEYVIDQDTDNPVIITDNNSINNTWAQISNKNDTTRSNVFNQGSQFLLKLIDDDGLSKYSVYSVKTETGNDNKPENPDSDANEKQIKGTKTQFAWTLPKDAGYYKVWLDVTDIMNKTTSVGPFFVQIASGIPSLFATNAKFVNSSPLPVELTIESTEGPFVINRDSAFIKDESGNDISSIPATGGTTTITDYYEIPDNKDDGEYSITYYVTDSNLNPNNKTTTYKLDRTPPVIESIKLAGEAAHTNWYKNDTMNLAIEANDGTKPVRSEIATVEYSLDNSNWTALTKKTDATSGKITYERSVSFANGSNTLYLRAIDNVGNVKTENKTVQIDVTAPDFTINHNGNYIYINKTAANQSLVLYGQYKDEQSGVGALSIALGTTSAEVKYYSGDSTNINDVEDSSYVDYAAANAKKIKFWRAEFTKAKLETIFATDKSKNLTISGSNVAGKAIANTPNLTIMIDKEDPYFENINLKGSDSKGVYKKSETQYYASTKIDATHNRTFTLTGIAKDDDSGISKVSCKVGSAAAVETQDSGWTFPVTLAADGQSVTVVLTAYDKAGNSLAQNTITITTDNTAPEGIHKVDAKQKNAVFRIGNNNNDDITSETAASFKTNNVALTWNSYTPEGASEPVTGIDTDVGKKYSSETYGNAETVKVRGYFKEEGSGISLIYYKIFDEQPLSSNTLAQDFLANYEEAADGYFSTTSPVTKRVFYNKDSSHTFDGSLEATNGTKTLNYIYQDYNFYTTISGLVNTKNYLVLVAVDNVGNAALDGATVGDETYYDYQLNVDNDVPSVEAGDDFQEIINPALNPDSTITVYGTASDAAAGIRSLVAKINGTEIDSSKVTYTITKDGNYSKNNVWWKAEIKRSAFTGIENGKSASVQITATDDAGTGNSETFSVANVIIDNVAPTITLTAPVDADKEVEGTQINGTISLSGTVSDSNVLPATVITGLEYKKGDNGAWTSVAGITCSGNYTFTIAGFNTSGLADGEYKLRAKGVDKSGNEGISNEVTVMISKDSDRPKLNITNLVYSSDLSTYLLRYGTNAQVTGTVTDDDSTTESVISKLYITESPYTGAQGQVTPTNLVNASGDFTFQPSNIGDGTKTFYIYIEDNKGGKFYSTATAANSNPKLYLKGTALGASANSTSFSYISDSLSPSVQLGKGLPYSLTAPSTYTIAKDSENTDFDTSKDNSNLNASFVVGGSARKFVKFYFTGNDASGIAGMSLEIKDSTDAQTVIKRLTTAASIAGTTFATTGTDPYTVDTGTFLGTQNASTDASWTTDYIDVSSWTTGQITAYITVYDRIGNSVTGSYSFSVDNNAPEIKVSSPASGEEKTGTISIAGQTNDTGSAGASNIQWIIPTTAEVTTANSKTGTEKLEYLKGLTWQGGKNKLSGETTVTAWQFDFDGTTNASLETYDSDTYASTISGGVYTLPVYFMATDALGNYTIKQDYIIRHNPDGDKPKVTFTYPTKESYDEGKTYVTLGGTIVPTGTAEIPSNTTSVRSVYLQIADDSGKFNATDKSKASETYGLTVVDAYAVINAIKGTSYSTSSTFTDAELKEFGFATKAELDAWWGVEVTGTASWRMQLNTDGKLNPIEDNTTNNIKIRACGVNANGKMGAWTQGDGVLSIHVDKGVPTISAVVNQYAAEVTSGNVPTIIASQGYTADMFIKGQWYLVLDILDESDISAIEVSSKVGETTVDNIPHVDTPITATVNGKLVSGCRSYVKIYKNVTAITYTIAATEGGDPGTAKTTRTNFSFKIDNTAPSLESIKNTNDEELSASGENKVQNSNYIYTLKGESDDFEGGSGVEQVVFYYMRKSGVTQTTITNQVVLDPMIKANNGTYSTMPLTGTGALTEITIEGTTEKLYGESISGTISADSNGQYNTFTAASNFDEHVRVGGLIKVAGMFRKIASKSGAVVTFTPPATSGGSDITALFPIAQVIDASNTATSNSDNPFQFGSGKDDGDGMVESFSKSGSKWTWDATIHSENLPDGPATLVILAFDKAGNVAGTKYKMMVSNNAPRLAKVFLATDLNRDGSYSENEFETYNIAAAAGNTNGVEVYSLTTAGFAKYVKNAAGAWESNASTRKAFTIKNGLAILPELIGGNGTIGLVVNTNDETTDDDGKHMGTPATKSATLSGTNIFGDYWSFASTEFESDSAAQKMSFTFWDSTNECVSGTNSQYAFLRVNDFVIDQIDGVAPNVVVNPFYWKSASDNSLYGNSSANGHIELEADLTTAVTTLYGSDPKVSGKIVLKGTAYDETLLGSLSFSMTNFDSGSEIAVAEYGTDGWTIKKVGEGESAANPTMAANYYEVTVEDAYVSQDGHKANWTIAIDTAHLSDVAHEDATFTVIAKDQKSGTANSSADSTGTADATKHKPSYQMDVVPYITGLGTRLDDAYSAVTSVFNRSANGVYPVMRGETGVKLYGFNLKGANTTVKFNGTSVGTVTAGTTSDYVTFTVPTTAKSGEIDVTVNDISALNNKNKVDAQYNLEPNGINNNTLNDNRSVYVWGMDNIFNQNVTVRYPMFKVGKDLNQTVVFSYDRGGTTTYLNNNKTEYALGYSWTQWYDTAVAIDTSGNCFGLAQNGDSAVTNSVTPKECSSLFFYPFVADNRNVFTYTRTVTQSMFGGSTTTYYDFKEKYAFAWENTANGTSYNPNRIKNQKLFAVRDTNNTKIYSVYYDATDSAIKFRAGTSTGNNNASDNIANYSNGTNGSAKGVQVIESGNNAGEYASVGIIPAGLTGAGTAVVCWNSGNSLKFKYNTSPLNSSTWTGEITIDSDYAGEYCNLAVDAAGGIHIAYYRAGNKLKYAYLESYTDTTPDVCMVDSYLSVGENISIETSSKTISYTENGTTKTRYVPYISYYSSAIGMAKVAWPVKLGTNGSAANTFVNGVNNDMFTGDWEVQVLPTALTTKLLNYTIGVGEKKNGNKDANNQDIQSVMLGYGTKTGLQTALLY